MDNSKPFDEEGLRASISNIEEDYEPTPSPRDGEKLLKASIERRSQTATPIRSNACSRSVQQWDDDAALDGRKVAESKWLTYGSN